MILKNYKVSYVRSSLFCNSPFFNPNDAAQVKYEMLRAHMHEGRFITKVCKEFGYSRETFYQILTAFKKEGVRSLVDKHVGKKKPDKITPEIVGFAIYQRAKFGLSGAKIAKLVESEFGVLVHKVTIERILKRFPPK